MDTNITDRITKIMDFYGLNPHSFSVMIGIRHSTVTSMLYNKTYPSYTTIVNILSAFPDINIVWFISGIGPMFNVKMHKKQALN